MHDIVRLKKEMARLKKYLAGREYMDSRVCSLDADYDLTGLFVDTTDYGELHIGAKKGGRMPLNSEFCNLLVKQLLASDSLREWRDIAVLASKYNSEVADMVCVDLLEEASALELELEALLEKAWESVLL